MASALSYEPEHNIDVNTAIANTDNNTDDNIDALIRQLEEMDDMDFFNLLLGLSGDAEHTFPLLYFLPGSHLRNDSEAPQLPVWSKTELQNIYLFKLQELGFLPSVDKDGDIHFNVFGNNYFIIIDEKDIQFFQIYMGFSLPFAAREQALDAANEANRISKVAKVTVSSPQSERLIISITSELLLNFPEYFEQIFVRAISLIRNAERNFISLLNQE